MISSLTEQYQLYLFFGSSVALTAMDFILTPVVGEDHPSTVIGRVHALIPSHVVECISTMDGRWPSTPVGDRDPKRLLRYDRWGHAQRPHPTVTTQRPSDFIYTVKTVIIKTQLGTRGVSNSHKYICWRPETHLNRRGCFSRPLPGRRGAGEAVASPLKSLR